MRAMTKLLTSLNVLVGSGCSAWVLASAWNSKAEVYPAYLKFGILVPAVASLLVTILGLMLEQKWNWSVIRMNVVAYATVFILIGTLGLPEAIKEKNYDLFLWLAFAFGTMAVSFAGCLVARLIMRKRIAQPATAPCSEPSARSLQG